MALESATAHDAHALVPAIEAVTEQGLKPTQLLADSAYGSEDNLERARELGGEVVTPTLGAYLFHLLPLSEFVFSYAGEVLRCPQGQEPERIGHFRAAFH